LTDKTVLTRFRDCEAALRNTELKQALYDAGGVIMSDVLLTLHGKDHSARRSVEARVFRRNFFRYYEQEVFPDTFERTLAPFVVAGGGDLIELGYRSTANLTADFAGIDRPEQSVDETETLIRLVKKFSEGATLVHSTREPAEVEGEVLEALEEFRERFHLPSVAKRRVLLEQLEAGEITKDDLPRDVLTVILQNENELRLPDDVLLREMAFYMQAGAHSTANAMVHSFHECVVWAGQDDDRWQRLDDPAFVQKCVHESLRLHPASPEAWRTGTCPMAVAGAGDIAKGDSIVLDLFSANRDAELFGDDAEQFDPDRATPKTILPSGLAFGIGLHTCLGRELDGGVPTKPGSDPATHQLGIVTLILDRLLQLGARPDPGDPALPDTKTSRPNWGSYPVIFLKD
jgi:cytochrome P450